MHLLPSPLLAATEGAGATGSVDPGIYGRSSVIIALPLAGFAFTTFFGRRLQATFGRNVAAAVPLGVVVAAWVVAMVVVTAALQHQEPFGEHGLDVKLWTWIPAGELSVDLGFHVDSLTAVLLVVVTTIGMLVHLYSVGYMAHDPGTWRFFAYLNLFMVSMLVLGLASNWVLVFAGMGAGRVSSYSLIGFWYQGIRRMAPRRRSSSIASATWLRAGLHGHLGQHRHPRHRGSLARADRDAGRAAHRPALDRRPARVRGRDGQERQFPPPVWLRNAMEGPTRCRPIHAATMVNAGVYLVARATRCSRTRRTPWSWWRRSAYSPPSWPPRSRYPDGHQAGARVLHAVPAGLHVRRHGHRAFVAAIFHLMTHGFFKGLLFLGSGSVIHAVHEEQDMNRMGGLWRKIPITHWTMLAGTLAIAGIPPLAGFFSKDEILGESFTFGFYWVWAIGAVVAVMTAFYMWRLMGKTFYGESRVDRTWSRRSTSRPGRGCRCPAGDPGRCWDRLTWGGRRSRRRDRLLVGWLEPVFVESEHLLTPSRAYALFGIDGVLILPAWQRHVGSSSDLAVRFFRAVAARLVDRIASASGPRFLYRASLNIGWFDDLNDLLFIRIGGGRRVPVVVRPHDRGRDGQRAVALTARDAGGGPASDPDGRGPELRAGHRDRADRHGRFVPPDREPRMNVNDIPIVSLIVFLPLLGAIVVAFLPGSRPDLVRWTALGFALAAWVVSLVLLVGYTPGRPGFQYLQALDWIPLFGIQYKVGVDGLSMAMVVLTTTLTWISILASFGPIQTRVKEYMVSFLVLEVGMVGVFVALDLFLFYVFWGWSWCRCT